MTILVVGRGKYYLAGRRDTSGQNCALPWTSVLIFVLQQEESGALSSCSAGRRIGLSIVKWPALSSLRQILLLIHVTCAACEQGVVIDGNAEAVASSGMVVGCLALPAALRHAVFAGSARLGHSKASSTLMQCICSSIRQSHNFEPAFALRP